MAIDLKNPNTQKSLLAFLGVGMLGYLFFLAPFVPANFSARARRLAELELRYEKLGADLTKARQAVASLDRLEGESRKLHERWEVVREQLPDQRELASLLRRITLSGSQAGVHFQLFRPDPAVSSQYYTDNPVKITVVGGYHQVGTFLSEIANLGRLVNSHSLELTTFRRAKDDEVTTMASFVASAYTLNGNAGTARSTKDDGKAIAKGGSPNVQAASLGR